MADPHLLSLEEARARILEDARQAAERIKADAGSAVDREFRRARPLRSMLTVN